MINDRELRDIFWRVKTGFKYVSDEYQYGSWDHWVTPEDPDNVTGDCEDFALACRKLAREHNYESRLIYCKTETGGGHCVLSVGGWVMDNRRDSIERKEHLPYEWVAMSGLNPGDPWSHISQ